MLVENKDDGAVPCHLLEVWARQVQERSGFSNGTLYIKIRNAENWNLEESLAVTLSRINKKLCC